MFELASSAGVHVALVPARAGETPLLGAAFALSALSLLGVPLRVDRASGPVALATAVLLRGSLLTAYAANAAHAQANLRVLR